MTLTQQIIIYAISIPTATLLLAYVFIKFFDFIREVWRNNNRKKKRIVFAIIALIFSINSAVSSMWHLDLSFVQIFGILIIGISFSTAIWGYIFLKLFDCAESAWKNHDVKKKRLLCLFLSLLVVLRYADLLFFMKTN